MSCTVIDHARLAFVKQRYLKDTGIVKRQVFVLDSAMTDFCWHCTDKGECIYRLPLDGFECGNFCSVNCMYSYVVLHNMLFHEPVANIVNKIRIQHNVKKFYIIPPSEFITPDSPLANVVSSLKTHQTSPEIYETILHSINNRLHYIVYKT